VIAVQFTVDDTNHHRLIDLERPGGENTFSFFVSSPEFEAVIHRRLLSAGSARPRVIKLRARQNRCAAEGLLDHGLLILASHPIGHGRFKNREDDHIDLRPASCGNSPVAGSRAVGTLAAYITAGQPHPFFFDDCYGDATTASRRLYSR